MISLRTRYFSEKVSWGLLFIFFGTSNLYSKDIYNLLFWPMIIAVLVIFLITHIKKSEPDDELAIANMRRAKASVYQIIVYSVLAWALSSYVMDATTLHFTKNLAFSLFGYLQITEYIEFMIFEQRVDNE